MIGKWRLAIEAFWQQLQDKRASSGQLKHFC
jgi:hypothetical protein